MKVQSQSRKPGERWRTSQCLISGLMAVALAACQPEPQVGIIGSVEGFAGAVAADEPRAATVARDVLGANGSAVDAAVALYFALAVTLPSSAGLGGGGVCLVHDPESKKVEALDFLPRAAAGGRVAVPGNARGMAALHARYGRMRWEQLLAPAEELARFGTPMSRALAREVATAEDLIKADPGLAQIFIGANGALLDEGDPLQQTQLASIIAQIRQKGAGEIYVGSIARTLSDAAQAMGAPLTMDDLRGTVPQWRETVQVPMGFHILHLAPPPAAAGVVEAQLIVALSAVENYAGTGGAERAHLMAEASMRVLAARGDWMGPDGASTVAPAELVAEAHVGELMRGYDAARATPAAEVGAAAEPKAENPWATSFVVADRDGQAVACNVTMNALFGAGRIATGTGIVLAAAPGRPGLDSLWLGPALLVNPNNFGFYYAAAASGGPTAATAMASVALDVIEGDRSLASAIEARRVHHNAAPDVVYYEPGEDAGVLADLKARGHTLEEAGVLGRVQAIWCPQSIQSDPEKCQVSTDPRADGLALVLSE